MSFIHNPQNRFVQLWLAILGEQERGNGPAAAGEGSPRRSNWDAGGRGARPAARSSAPHGQTWSSGSPGVRRRSSPNGKTWRKSSCSPCEWMRDRIPSVWMWRTSAMLSGMLKTPRSMWRSLMRAASSPLKKWDRRLSSHHCSPTSRCAVDGSARPPVVAPLIIWQPFALVFGAERCHVWAEFNRCD